MIITTVDMRVYPMFAFLFGYGIVQLYRRQIDAGTEDRTARRILRRRHWWLIAFGFVDAALLWMGDVLAAYGLAGLIMVALFFRRRDRTLLIWAGVGTALLTLGMIFAVVGSFFAAQAVMSGEPSSFFEPALAVAAQPNYLASIPMRLLVWAILTPLQGILFLVVPIVMLLSFWAARRQILERPGDHLRLLRRVAVIGIAIGWLGGLPHALDHVGVLPGAGPGGLGVQRHPGTDRDVCRGRLCRGLRSAGAPDQHRQRQPRWRRGRTEHSRPGDHGRRAPVSVVLPGAIGHLRADPLRLGPGPGCRAGQRDHGPVRDRGLVAHGDRGLSAGAARSARSGRGRCCGDWSIRQSGS